MTPVEIRNTLKAAKTKLELYRANVSGGYVGGMGYMTLICQINEALDSKPLTAEEFAVILWPGLFNEGWQSVSADDPWQQARFYCIEKAQEMLKTIEVRWK